MKQYLKKIYLTSLILSVLGILSIVLDFGFQQSKSSSLALNFIFYSVIVLGLFSTIVKYIENTAKLKNKAIIFDALTVLFSIALLYIHLFEPSSVHKWAYKTFWIKLAVILSFVREFAEVKFNYKKTLLNPAQVFIASFLAIIFLGSLLFLLPNATSKHGISFIDSLFTATSAVCITGLSVVDTAKDFTQFGQIILVLLIQIGGLGILTFASYFSYFFKGGSSYDNHLALSDLTNSKKLSEVFSTLWYIISITFIIEVISCCLIYFSVPAKLFDSEKDHLFFSVFHSVSAFCNAGFSNIPDGMYNPLFRYKYSFQIVIAATFIMGGLGFPIVSNIVNYFKYKIKGLLSFGKLKDNKRPWVLNLNSRITLVTTFALILIGTLGFYLFEYSNSLSQHHGFGKMVAALFGGTSPRTAGFNTVDLSHLKLPSIFLIIFLMWVGASPSSTGGGIKTSTLAIAILSIISIARGSQKINVYRREIAFNSVQRAFAIIFLSLFAIGTGALLIAIAEPKINLLHIVFECFSAYGTVGLTLGITAKLGTFSKLILILLMFVGRVSMLSILIALFTREKIKNYRYPSEELTIN
jgi:potassium uptake TrkH family protein